MIKCKKALKFKAWHKLYNIMNLWIKKNEQIDFFSGAINISKMLVPFKQVLDLFLSQNYLILGDEFLYLSVFRWCIVEVLAFAFRYLC